MRVAIAALALLALSACASGPAPAPSGGGWWFERDGGRIVATQREPSGAVTATFTCRPPDGDIVIADPTLRGGRARVTVGGFSVEVDARSAGAGIEIALPQRPPILAAVGGGAAMSISAGGRTHALADGASIKLREVADACWGAQ